MNWNKIKVIGKTILLYTTCIIIALIFIIMCAGVWKHSSIDLNKPYGIPELLYYTTQIVGVFATVAAVIVALFGREIRGYIFREKIRVFLVDGGFREMLGDSVNTPNPISQSYDCSIAIENACSKELEEVQIFLTDVSYRVDANSKIKKLKVAANKALYWRSVENLSTDISIEETRRIPLFKIYPKGSCQTPDGGSPSPLQMRIIGYQLPEKYNKKGIWNAKYQIRTKTKVLKRLEVTVDWTGVWYGRIFEMAEEVVVNLEEL